MRNLEDQLGARLLARTTRQVRLTPEGERYLARCAPALEGHAVRARGLYAVYPSHRLVPRRLTAFVAAVAEAFAQRPDLVWAR